MESVYCTVRTGYLNKTDYISVLFIVRLTQQYDVKLHCKQLM